VNRTLPELGTSVTNPVFNIQKINITGDGGIIGSAFGAADIGTITVAPTGFGILNSDFNSSADGVLKSLTAGGYGIRQVFFNGNRVNALNATGNGAIASLTQFSNRVRSSEGGTIDPYTGVAVSSDTDLDLFMKQVGLGDSDFRTGVIGNSNFVGQNLGNITAFTMEGAASLVPGTTAPPLAEGVTGAGVPPPPQAVNVTARTTVAAATNERTTLMEDSPVAGDDRRDRQISEPADSGSIHADPLGHHGRYSTPFDDGAPGLRGRAVPIRPA